MVHCTISYPTFFQLLVPLHVKNKGVVLAINARVLYKNLKPFDSILKEYPQVQLLIWTGTGEPPISESKIDGIKSYFETNGYIDQIGFDCQVRRGFGLIDSFNTWHFFL